MEEEGNLGAGGSATAPNAGGEGTSASQPGTGESPVLRLCFPLFFSWIHCSHCCLGPPSTNMEDVDIVVGDIPEEAAAEADRIAAEEAAKDAGEAAKGAAEDAAAGAARTTGEASAEGAS